MPVRRMTAADAARVADLAGQLGYPAAADDIARRFETLAQDTDHALFVADEGDRGIGGFLHVAATPALLHERLAEILSLVVDEVGRGRGTGTLLVAAAEAWSRERGATRLRVRCQLAREQAHTFYRNRGFRHTKTQHVFDRDLEP